jgi:uncharacterized protein YcbK (DUF882 family)
LPGSIELPGTFLPYSQTTNFFGGGTGRRARSIPVVTDLVGPKLVCCGLLVNNVLERARPQVPDFSARTNSFAPGSSFAGKSFGMAALILLLSCQGLQSAAADGDTRTLSMHHIHTDENIAITYKRDGRYDEVALKQLNWFLRDWRRQEQISMDPHLLDLIWEVSREVGSHKPIEVVCGYRSPQTNAMLRRRSGGVARFSQHMLGHAMDFYVPDASLEEVRIAGLRLQRGGVGFYPTSGTPFVHLDTGSVRHWPRMSREQLVRVFPDGRTVHVPTDGRPLAGYALALADIEKRGNAPSQMSLDSARAAGVVVDRPNHNLFASLFARHTDEDEDGDSAAVSSDQAATPRSAEAGAKRTRAAPSPATYHLAAASQSAATSASTQPVQATLNTGQPSASDVIANRGNWDGSTASPRVQLKTASIISAPRPGTNGQADPKTIASGGPWASVPSVADPGQGPAAEGVALAYAADESGRQKTVVARATPMGLGPSRAYGAPSVNPTTVLPKSPLPAPSAALQQTSPAPAPPMATPMATPSVAVKVGDRFDDPWLRALVVAPDLQNYMTVTSFDVPDFRQLRPMMEKPVVSVRMTFSQDPQMLATDHFSGSAVVFLSTLAFGTRTASLQ